MATYTFDKIDYGGNTYVVSDSGALQLTGGQVTGPVTFGDSVSIDEVTLGDLVVNGNASFTNNIQANTINGVTVGNSPKFTDTPMTVTTTGSGNAVTAVSASGTTITVTKGATYSNNAGTITGVTAGTGLSGGGTSGSVTLNHSNSVTAQTTQAVYPIKIDAQGHISAYGSAVTIPDVSGKIDTAGTGLSKSGTTLNHSNSVTAQTTQAIYPIKIDAQGHISAYGSAVTPLTSHQTIKQDGVTGATGNHYGACSTAASTAAKTVSITAGTPALEAGLRVTVKFANANTAGTPTLNVNSLGAKNIFHNGAQITTGTNKALLAGTVEFVYDGTQWQLVGNYINTTYTIPTITLNGSFTTSPSFYAPTGAGTSGQYLKSSGSGAPTWTNFPTIPSITLNGSASTSPSFYAPTSAGTSGYYLKSNGSGAPTWTAFPTIPTDTNTTYALSGALSSHKFTSTLTAGGSGSGTSTSDFTLEAGTGITITDDTSARKMTIACSVTNTDTKLQVAEVTSGTQYYPLVGTGTTAATRQYDTTGFTYKGTNGTTSAVGSSILVLGNATGSGTANNKQAQLVMYGSNTKKATITLAAPSADIALALPTSGGTLALTSQIPSVPSSIVTDVKISNISIVSNGVATIPTASIAMPGLLSESGYVKLSTVAENAAAIQIIRW